jgi:hypothetical protein
MRQLTLLILISLFFTSYTLAQPLYPFYNQPTRLFGYETLASDTIIPAQFCHARSFQNEYAVVYLCQNRRAPLYTQIPALINTKGEVIFQLEERYGFPVGASFRQNRIPVIKPTWEYVFFNLAGELAIDAQYEKAWSFGEGWAGVEDLANPGIYFIDTAGNKVAQLPEGYRLIDNSGICFSEGLIAVMNKQTGKMGFMNKNGEIVIPCTFDQVGNFNEGKAYAAMITNTYMNQVGKNRIGYINQEGEWVIELSSEKANLPNGCYFEGGEFNGGVAQMCIRENDGDCMNAGCLWLDGKGKILREDWE